MPKDAYFIDGIVNSDKKVLVKIYHQFFSKVKFFVINNSGSIEDAEDVFQNALIQLYVKLKENKNAISSTFEGYLFTVCKNLWRRELNKNRVTKTDVVQLVHEEQDHAMAFLEQNQWDLYIEMFQRLSENCQKILSLYFNNTPYSDLVKLFNYSSEVVARQRIFKCKSRLVQLIKQDVNY